MLYTIHQLDDDPIFIVRVYPPLLLEKQIYAVDRELLRLTAHLPGRIYRIDDLTRLRAHQFTISDARAWFTGDIREDAQCRSPIEHVAVCKYGIFRLLPRLTYEGHTVYVPPFASVEEAVIYSRIELARHSGR